MNQSAIIINTPATQSAQKAMTQAEIREYYEDQQCTLSRDYRNDIKVYEDAIRMREAKFQRDSERLARQQAAAMHAVEVQHKAAHHIKP